MSVIANMAVAMVSIIWSMGLLIGLGHPVHIMSSMSPVFLMAIATDSVHIFSEFTFRFGELKVKRRAIVDTMKAVASPVFFSDITTAVGFVSLANASRRKSKVHRVPLSLQAWGTVSWRLAATWPGSRMGTSLPSHLRRSAFARWAGHGTLAKSYLNNGGSPRSASNATCCGLRFWRAGKPLVFR